MIAWTLLAVTVIGLLAWPFVHLAMLWHGVEILGDRPPTLRMLAKTALVTGLCVLLVQLGVSCLGSAVPVVGPALLSLIVAVAVRTACYGAMLSLPTRSAFGLALGVSVVSWAYMGALLALAAGGVWGFALAAQAG